MRSWNEMNCAFEWSENDFFLFRFIYGFFSFLTMFRFEEDVPIISERVKK